MESYFPYFKCAICQNSIYSTTEHNPPFRMTLCSCPNRVLVINRDWSQQGAVDSARAIEQAGRKRHGRGVK